MFSPIVRRKVPLIARPPHFDCAPLHVEANLLVDGAAIGLEGAGMSFIGFAEHHPDQPVKQIDGLVRQAGSEIEGDGYQGGMPTLALVARDMLRRGACSRPACAENPIRAVSAQCSIPT